MAAIGIWFVLLLGLFVFKGFLDSVQSDDSKYSTIAKLVKMMEEARGPIESELVDFEATRSDNHADYHVNGSNDSATKWASRCRRLIVASDPGPICIMSINAHDVLVEVRDRLASDDEIQMKWILSNPLAREVIRRDRRLNGRYCEYYVRPFLASLLMQEKARRDGIGGRISIRVIDGIPSYRMVGSDRRVMLQKYTRWSHGHEEFPLIMERVCRVRLQPLVKRRLDGISALDFLDELVPPSVHLYQKMIQIFDNAFQSGDASEAVWIAQWPNQRLVDLAKRCGIKPKSFDGDSRSLSRQLCVHLDLLTEYETAFE